MVFLIRLSREPTSRLGAPQVESPNHQQLYSKDLSYPHTGPLCTPRLRISPATLVRSVLSSVCLTHSLWPQVWIRTPSSNWAPVSPPLTGTQLVIVLTSNGPINSANHPDWTKMDAHTHTDLSGFWDPMGTHMIVKLVKLLNCNTPKKTRVPIHNEKKPGISFLIKSMARCLLEDFQLWTAHGTAGAQI